MLPLMFCRQASLWEASNAQQKPHLDTQAPGKRLPAASVWHPAEGVGSGWWGPPGVGPGGKTADARVTISLLPKKLPQLGPGVEAEGAGSQRRELFTASDEEEGVGVPELESRTVRGDGGGVASPGGSRDGGEWPVGGGGGGLQSRSWGGDEESDGAGESSGTVSPWWTAAEQLPLGKDSPEFASDFDWRARAEVMYVYVNSTSLCNPCFCRRWNAGID